MAALTFVICRTASKLKHLVLRVVHYQLVNTSLICMNANWNDCECDKFSGCRVKPRHRRLTAERNYYFFCRTRITFHIDRIYRINKIKNIINTFLELKEHIELCIDFGHKKFWFYGYPKMNRYPCVKKYIFLCMFPSLHAKNRFCFD